MTRSDLGHLRVGGKSGVSAPPALSAFEALCLAAKRYLASQSADDFTNTLSALRATWPPGSAEQPALAQTCALLLAVHAGQASAGGPAFPPVLFRYRPDSRILVLAGSTEAASEDRLGAYEAPLAEALSAFSGTLISGGTPAGVCALAARAAARANRGGAKIELVGYLPAGAEGSPDYSHLVRTTGADFSIAEPLQMWADLLASGIAPPRVTLLCFGGGPISAQELALAWALGARVFAIDAGGTACKRFSTLLSLSQSSVEEGVLLPSDPAALLRVFNCVSTGRRSPYRRAGPSAGGMRP